MHDARHDGPLSDAALDRAIEQALAVDHSPELVARVRRRIAGESMSGRQWSGAWELSLGVAAASAVLAAAVWMMGPSRSTEPAVARTDVVEPHASASVTERERSEASAVLVNPETSVRIARPATPRRVVAVVPARSMDAVESATAPLFLAFTAEPLRLPDVVLAPDEQEALAGLLAPRRPEPERVPEPELKIAELPALTGIEVPEIVVEPLALMARLEGELP